MNGWLVFCGGILPFPGLVGEFMFPLSSSSTLEVILNPVRDIQNENIVRKILKGAWTMGHLSKCFILNTWMYHHMHNRFDLCMKGISPAHPFSSLYSLCICIYFHVFLCENINSHINADSLKPTWKTPGFVPGLYHSTNAALFSPVSVSIHVRAEDNELHAQGVPLCCSRLVSLHDEPKTEGFMFQCMWEQPETGFVSGYIGLHEV